MTKEGPPGKKNEKNTRKDSISAEKTACVAEINLREYIFEINKGLFEFLRCGYLKKISPINFC
jgi:hypothetical protein